MRALAVSLALLVPPALAGPDDRREVRFPLTIDYELLSRLASAELRGPGAEATVLWRSDDGCSVFEIARVRVEPSSDGALEIRADGEGRAGVGVLSWCLFPIERDADLRILARPALGPDWQLRLADVQATVVDREGRSTFLMRRLSGAMGEPIEEAVGRVRVDLTPPVEDVRGVIRSSLDAEHGARALAAIESLRPVGVRVAPVGVQAEISMTVPPAPPGPPELVGPEPPLSDDERRAWEDALGNWDAFLTFTVKKLGFADADAATRDELFRLFVDGRHALLGALAAGPQRGRDPVRALFLDSWERLRRVVRRVARRHDGDRADTLLYVRFLLAGDALAALERVGPDVGVEISADGLRRLARTLDPQSFFDPRARPETPDPELRALFGFHEPPVTPLPPVPPEPPAQTPALAPPDASGAPGAGAPDGTGTSPPPGDTSWFPLLVGVAHAADTDSKGTLRAIGTRLDRWLPTMGELGEYRDVIARLLDIVAGTEHEGATVPASTRGLFRQLVRATAWQESCWHHYTRRNGRVVALSSRTGDVGLMQVNRRIWRGVFDPALLERDVVYNADAGAQILAQYMTRSCAREAGVKGASIARATYAAYNGGPAACTRYRTGRRATPYTRRVDAAFWKKWQVVTAGRELEHVPCPPRLQ